MNEHIKALQSSDGKGYLPQQIADKLAAEGLVQIHPSAKDSNGNPAVRLTEKGVSMTNTTDAATVTAAEKAAITFDSGVPLPPKADRTERKSGQFDSMNVGQSAHFAGDAKAMFKKYSSLPSALTRRYSETVVGPDGAPVMETRKSKKKGDYQAQKRKPVREYVLRRVGTDDPKGAGVRLFRTA